METIVTGVLARLGDAGRRRMQRVEDCAREWNLYQDDWRRRGSPARRPAQKRDLVRGTVSKPLLTCCATRHS